MFEGRESECVCSVVRAILLKKQGKHCGNKWKRIASGTTTEKREGGGELRAKKGEKEK